MNMTITVHKTVEMKSIICPDCNVPAHGQADSGLCFHCDRIKRERKTANALAAVEALPGKIARYMVFAVGLALMLIVMYLGSGQSGWEK